MNQHTNTSPNEQRQQARQLLQDGQFDQARALYETLCHAHPQDAELQYLLGSTCANLKAFAQAAQHFRQAIDLHPGAAIAHCALGAALDKLGEPVSAEESYRQALAIKPEDPDIICALARVLIRLEKLSATEQLLQEAQKNNIQSADIYYLQGSIHHLRRDMTKALDCYTRAVRLNPELAAAHNQIGFINYSSGKLDKAIEHYQEAIRIAPNFVDAHVSLGHSLLLASRAEEAKSAFLKALDIAPNNLDAIAGEAILLHNEGDIQAVHDRCLPLIRKGIEHSGLAISYAGICNHFGCCEEAAAYAENVLANQKHKITMQEQLHFTLGKLYDSLGRYDQAFSHYQQGNASKSDTFRPAEFTAIIHTLMETFNWQFMTTAPRARRRSERPLFIIGMPRSGTTLAEQVLASHNAVYGAGELTYIADLARNITNRLGSPPGFPQNLRKLDQSMVDSMASTYLHHLEELAPDAARVTDKMPQNFIYLGLIALAFPEARVVHCVRDPRDTCLSIYFQNFNDQQNFSSKLDYLGMYYRDYHRLMQHWKSHLDIPIMDLHYEEMVSDQEGTSRRLLAFAGLEWDQQVLDFHNQKRAVVTASYDQVRRPIYKSSAGRWKHYEQHLQPLLKALDGLQTSTGL